MHQSLRMMPWLLVLLWLPVGVAHAQYSYSTNADGVSLAISGYNGLGGALVIPAANNQQAVTAIGAFAFDGNSRLTSVTIPNSVTSIGDSAFADCGNLTNVCLGTSVASIGDSAFFQSGLTRVTLPNSVTSVADYAFGWCGDLASVALSTNLVSLGTYVFSQSGLTNVSLTDGITNIPDYTFAGCPRLTSVTLDAGLLSIGEGAFDGAFPYSGLPLQSIIIPDSVISIGDYAFEGCASLQNITLGNGVLSIGNVAFGQCGFSRLVIPNRVTNIDYGAFSDCPNLQSVIIGNGVASLASQTFASCTSLTNVIVGKAVASITDDAFSSCVLLQSIYFEGNAPAADNFLFQDEPDATAYYLPGTTGWGATFAGLLALEWNAGGPVITVQPQSVTVAARSAVSLNVLASGPGMLGYQWLRNGTNLPGANACTLTIPNVSQTSLGTYSVLVYNEFGSATSSGALLELYPYISVPFSGVITYWGQTATFGVVAGGTGPLSYQWFQNGVSLPNQTSATLTLSNMPVTAAGLYTVIVTSPLGSVTNPPEQVVVEPAGLALGFYPFLTISGVSGYSYIIQSSTNLANSAAWITLTNLTLTQPIQLWVDTSVVASSPQNPKNYYRVLPGQ